MGKKNNAKEVYVNNVIPQNPTQRNKTPRVKADNSPLELSFIELINQPILIVSKDFSIYKSNTAARILLEISKKEIINTNLKQYISGETKLTISSLKKEKIFTVKNKKIKININPFDYPGFYFLVLSDSIISPTSNIIDYPEIKDYLINNSSASVSIKNKNGKYIFINESHYSYGIQDSFWLGKTDKEINFFDTAQIKIRKAEEKLILLKKTKIERIEIIKLNNCTTYWKTTKFLIHSSTISDYLIAEISFEITNEYRRHEVTKTIISLNQQLDQLEEGELLKTALELCEKITESKISFLHFVNPDQETISLQLWSSSTLKMCSVEEKTEHYPISVAGVWVDCIHKCKPVIHNDYNDLTHKKGLPPGHVHLIRDLAVPIFLDGKIVAIIGVGNKPAYYNEFDIEFIQIIGDNIWKIVSRKRVEQQLKQKEEQFRRIFENIHLIAITLDTTGKILFVNDYFLLLTGYESSEIIDKNWFDFLFDENDKKLLEYSFNEIIYKKKHIHTYESRIITKNKENLYVKWSNSIQTDSAGNVLRITNLGENITQKKFNEELLNWELRLSNTIHNTESLDEVIYVCLLSSLSITNSNSAAIINIVGNNYLKEFNTGFYEDSVLIIKNYLTRIEKYFENNNPLFDAINRNHILYDKLNKENISSLYFLPLQFDKTTKAVLVLGTNSLSRPYYMSSNYLINISSAISQYIQKALTKETLRENQRMLNTLMNNLPGVAYRCRNDENWTMEYFNDKVFEITGYKNSEFIYNAEISFGDIIFPDDRQMVWDTVQNALNNKGSYIIEYRIITKSGDIKWLWEKGSGVYDENFNLLALEGFMLDITDRKKSDQALTESEIKYRSLFTTMNYGFALNEIIYNSYNIPIDYRFLVINPALGDILGITPEEAENHTANEIIRYSDFILLSWFASVVEFNVTKSIEYYSAEFNKTFEITAYPQGTKRFAVIFRDITEKKEFENNIKKLLFAIEQSQVSIVITNADGIIEYVNPKFTTVSGYSFEEVLGKKPSILKSGKISSDIYKELWYKISSGIEYSGIFPNKKKNGELFWESEIISPVKNEFNKITHFIAVKEDITEKVTIQNELEKYRHQLEEMVKERTSELKQSEHRFRRLAESSNDLIIRFDKTHYLLYANPAAERYFNLSSRQFIFRPVKEVFSDNEFLKVFESSLSTVFTTKHQLRFDLMLNEEVWIDWLLIPETNNDNTTESVISFGRDITERKKLEETMMNALVKEKEINDLKTNFISMASHEFRTPLTNIYSASELIEMMGHTWDREKTNLYLKNIQNSVESMISMLNDILILSRSEKGYLQFEPEENNLFNICKEIINKIKSSDSGKHSIEFEFDLINPVKNIDKKLLTLILENIIQNAVNYTQEDGVIVITVKEKIPYIVISVSDNGKGIDEADIPHIFEPFYRAKSISKIAGSGLGLSVVKTCVELHNGYVNINSKPNIGTNISIYLLEK